MSEPADQPDPTDQTPAGPFSRRMFAVMSHGPFGRYAVGETISMTGTWMQTMAQSWVMAGLTNRAVMLGLVNFVSALPMLALSMYGGTVADKYDKRKILIAANVVQIVLALVVGWLVMTGPCKSGTSSPPPCCWDFRRRSRCRAPPRWCPNWSTARTSSRPSPWIVPSFTARACLGPSLRRAGSSRGMGTASAFFANAASFLAMILALITIARAPSWARPRRRNNAPPAA